MRKLLTPRRSLRAASTLLLAASSLALLTPADASAARDDDAIVRRIHYSDASMTTAVGWCTYNYRCWGVSRRSGTVTATIRKPSMNARPERRRAAPVRAAAA